MPALTWTLWWGGQLELRQIHLLLCLHVWTLWSFALHSMRWSMTQPWFVHIYLYVCLCLSNCMCVWCEWCIFMWLSGHLVLQAVCLVRMKAGKKGPRPAHCLCDSLPPVSVLTHMILSARTGHPLLSFQITTILLIILTVLHTVLVCHQYLNSYQLVCL